MLYLVDVFTLKECAIFSNKGINRSKLFGVDTIVKMYAFVPS